MQSGALDRCGVTLLAGKAVGAPFVGAVAATLALSEVLRLLQGGAIYEVLDLDLKALEHRTAILSGRDFKTINPGYVKASPARAKGKHPLQLSWLTLTSAGRNVCTFS